MWWDKSIVTGDQKVTAITFLKEVFVDKNRVQQDWASFKVLVGPNNRGTGLPTQTVKLDSRSSYSELRTLCVHAIGTAVDYLLTTQDDLSAAVGDGPALRPPSFGATASSAAASDVRPVPFPNERQGGSYRPEFTAKEQQRYPLFIPETDDSAVAAASNEMESTFVGTPPPQSSQARRGTPGGPPSAAARRSGQDSKSAAARRAEASAYELWMQAAGQRVAAQRAAAQRVTTPRGGSAAPQGRMASAVKVLQAAKRATTPRRRQGGRNDPERLEPAAAPAAQAPTPVDSTAGTPAAAPAPATVDSTASSPQATPQLLRTPHSAVGKDSLVRAIDDWFSFVGGAATPESEASAEPAGSTGPAGSASPQTPPRWFSTSPHLIAARHNLETARRLVTQASPYPVSSIADLSFKSILPTRDNRYQTRRYESNVSPSVSIRECYAIGAYLRTHIDWKSWSRQEQGNRRRKFMLPQHKDDADAGGALTTSRVQTAYAYVNESNALEIVVWTVVRPDTIYSIVASPHLEWSDELSKHKAELLVSPYDDRLLHKAVHVMRLEASRTHTFKVVDGTFSTISPDPLQSFLMMPRLVDAMAQLIRTPIGVGYRPMLITIKAIALEHGALSALYASSRGRSMSADKVFDQLLDDKTDEEDPALSDTDSDSDSEAAAMGAIEDESKGRGNAASRRPVPAAAPAASGILVPDSNVKQATGIATKEITQYANQKLRCYTFGSTFVETTDEGRRNRDYTDISSVFRGTTSIDAEYRKYCDPGAEEIGQGDVMSAALDSAKLLCLVQTIEKPGISTRAHFTRRMLSKAQQMRGSRQTDDMMRLMRSMQIGDEFDQYFTIPTSHSSASKLRTNFRITSSNISQLPETLHEFSGSLPAAR